MGKDDGQESKCCGGAEGDRDTTSAANGSGGWFGVSGVHREGSAFCEHSVEVEKNVCHNGVGCEFR